MLLSNIGSDSEVQLMKKAWDLEQKERSDERTANMD